MPADLSFIPLHIVVEKWGREVLFSTFSLDITMPKFQKKVHIGEEVVLKAPFEFSTAAVNMKPIVSLFRRFPPNSFLLKCFDFKTAKFLGELTKFEAVWTGEDFELSGVDLKKPLHLEL